MRLQKSLGNKVVLAKIPREEYSRFQQYCDQNGESINASLRRMILLEINNPQPTKIAGKSVFTYNRQKDNFSWKIDLDEDYAVTIDDNLPANSVEHLWESLTNSIEERKSTIKKSKKDSISIPNNLVRKKK